MAIEFNIAHLLEKDDSPSGTGLFGSNEAGEQYTSGDKTHVIRKAKALKAGDRMAGFRGGGAVMSVKQMIVSSTPMCPEVYYNIRVQVGEESVVMTLAEDTTVICKA